MSDDPPPPDLIQTAELPLDQDQTIPANGSDAIFGPDTLVGLSPPDVPTSPPSLFGAARPVVLSLPIAADRSEEGNILEGAERPFARITPAETIQKVRRFLTTGRDQAGPLYRRQGILAVVGLCLLGILVVFTFPRSRATLGSGVEVQGDPIEPAAPVAPADGNNRDDTLDAVGSDGLFTGSKTRRALRESMDDETLAGGNTNTASITVTETTMASVQLPTLAELLETSVVVGPEITCPNPAANPPECRPPVPATTSTTSGPTTTATTVATTSPTTAPSTTTSTRPTTTSTRPTTASTTATTRPPSTTTTRPPSTTTRPPSTTTTRPPSTTTTRPPSTTTSTSTSSPETTSTTASVSTVPGGPTEPSVLPGTAVACVIGGECLVPTASTTSTRSARPPLNTLG